MSSEQGDSNAIWGEGPNASEQDQQPDSSSTTGTPDKEGLVIPPIERDEVDLCPIVPSKVLERLLPIAHYEHRIEAQLFQTLLDFAGDPHFIFNH